MELVLGHGGSLKAEHGTGRMMAPYVRRQYGDELYEVMQEIKRLCDPRGMLNPGVLISDDPDAHLRHLKVAADGRGGGRPLRGMRLLRAGLPQQGPHHHPAAADRAAPGDAAGRGRRATPRCCTSCSEDYEYDAVDTCAVDGMCQTACPVLINTGDLVKRLRADNAGQAGGEGLGCRGQALGGYHPRRVGSR